MQPNLVADIGGTNARFALVEPTDDGRLRFDQIRILNAREYATFEAALQAYLDGLNGIRPRAMCVAIAGPVLGDEVRMTNLSWNFSCGDIAKAFGVDHFLAINDFAAVAAACAKLEPEHLVTIKPGTANPSANRAVFGPGTGLGVANLVHYRGRWLANPSEGGHVNLAPTNAFEADVIKAAMATHGHVSAETIISGPGFVNLYQAICQVRGARPEQLKPADITARALAGGDPLCVETMDTFCALAGSFAGNLALTYGAQGGVYIAGGVLPRFAEYLKASAFAERFRDKGIMSHYVESIPVHLIVHTETAFLGAAATLEQHLAGH